MLQSRSMHRRFSSRFTRLVVTAAALALACHGQDNTSPTGFVVGVLAGSTTSHRDGDLSAARFDKPEGVAIDEAGNLYVADALSFTIRKITATGAVSTLAGKPGVAGYADSAGSAARFRLPRGIAVDRNNNVYVTDSTSSTIRKITPSGLVTTLAGIDGQHGWVDGGLGQAVFDMPIGIAVNASGTIYVADAGSRTIRQIESGFVTTLAGYPSSGGQDGTGQAAGFIGPRGIAVDATGVVFVTDYLGIRRITPTGVVTTIAAGSGSDIGTAEAIVVDSSGNLYIPATFPGVILKISGSGAVSEIAGTRYQQGQVDGPGSVAQFAMPHGIARDQQGNLYIGDTRNDAIRKITSAGLVSTIAGSGVQSGDGAGAGALFDAPSEVAVDSAGITYVADWGNSTIRKITKSGTVETFAGAAGQRGSADGTGSAARFDLPNGVAVHSSGVVYVADTANHTIRKITPSGVVSTIAGAVGISAHLDGVGLSARLVRPLGLALDRDGNLYVSGGNTIRKITPPGVVSTLAGTSDAWDIVDGQGASARFGLVGGMATDRIGNIYITDGSLVRRVTAAGLVSTVAGTRTDGPPMDGTGSAARFGPLWGITIDSADNSYVLDSTGPTIRRITPQGVVTTIHRFESSQSKLLRGLARDAAGNLVISDKGKNLIYVAVPVSTSDSSRMVNLSVRSRAGTGDRTLIMGFVTAGGGSKQVLVRGLGPVLSQHQVAGAMADPVLKLFGSGSSPLSVNDNWGGEPTLFTAFQSVGATPLAGSSKDAALLHTSTSGGYSAHVTSVDGSAGIALAEVYDVDRTGPRLVNVSARSEARTGDDVLVAGLVVDGTGRKTLLIRGLGPTLSNLGVSGALGDPQLKLYNQAGSVLGENNDWGGSAALKLIFSTVGAAPMVNDTSKDAALLVTVDPGIYSVHVSSVSSTSGVALVEIYEVQQ